MTDSDGTKNSSNVAMSVTNSQWVDATDVHIQRITLTTIVVPGAIF